MTLLQIIVLAIVQGLTEFLPVSSSAHLILGGRAFGWPDQGLAFDVATHLGTLLAVLVYFRRELSELISAWRRPVEASEQQFHRTLGKCLLLASVPVILVGALVHDLVAVHLRDIRVIALTTIVFGALLWVVDAQFARHRKLSDMHLRPAVWIGLAQVFALVPGASRSGVTITMGRMLGFDADSAARFSFLLAIPVIVAAGAYEMAGMLREEVSVAWTEFGLAVLASALAGWTCIAVFLALLRRVGLLPFIVYRLALGGLLLILAF
ncbi:MAG: undecaprenyl-diphosphate phosphatase [Xanthomonadales bacterium]|nr:undecaprenyl-diphosphate phosphatase [Xanthomonadales bacterium]NIX12440.1 undecaprenyl-diphosphate phosphatase [Xanthomonadales bacterium]